jgi:Cu2+-exporting ATPase
MESTGLVRVVLDIQGLHCVACVWLIERLFDRTHGRGRIVINPARGRADLLVHGDFDLRSFVASVDRFGLHFGPPAPRAVQASRDLVWRLGVCAAIAMNSMIFGISMYAGLDRGPLYRLFTSLNFGLGALAVAVGGTVFLRSAFRALESRVLHLDLPIAVGIVLAFAGSAYSYFFNESRTSYFDTLDIFITLMLLGRWLQERVIERSRAWLLAAEGPEALLARRVREGRPEIVRCGELHAGDELLVAPGEIVAADATLQGREAGFSLDWISGESEPRTYRVGGVVPAGAILAGTSAARLVALTDFAGSPLRELVRLPEANTRRARVAPSRQRLAVAYVLAVMATAAVNFLVWLLSRHDVVRALDTTTAVLVVTCPCAIGIAVPLAYEIVQAGLLRRGLFVRRVDFLDRARDVTRVVFDKTGTVTRGELALADPAAVSRLPPDVRDALFELTASSAHPKAAAVRRALGGSWTPSIEDPALSMDVPGLGIELRRDGRLWRLGEPGWVGGSGGAGTDSDVGLSVDGAWLAGFRTVEELRVDAVNEVRELQRDGYAVWLLSGDREQRVRAIADAVGIEPGRALADRSPADKARFLAVNDRDDTLFIGDGVNDAPALDRAHVAGTPAVDRPFVPARADFFFITPGLRPVRLALRCARTLTRVVRADLVLAAAYNALATVLAVTGHISPIVCAVLMPLSSLTTTLMTAVWLSPRNRVWRS